MQKQNPVIKNYILSSEVMILKEKTESKTDFVCFFTENNKTKKLKCPY